MREFNPYEKPQAQTLQQAQHGVVTIGRHRRVSVAEALNWIGNGTKLLRENWWLVIAATTVVFLLNVALFFVPGVGVFVGPAVQLFLAPLFYAGLMHIVHELHTGRNAKFSDLFAGFSRRSMLLLQMVFLQIVVVLLLVLVFVALLLVVNNITNIRAASFTPVLWVFLVMMGGALLLASLMFYFAVPLIYLGGKGVGDALVISFNACVANVLPLLVYVIVAILLALLGLLLLGVGLLFVMPVLVCAYYMSFYDIFISQDAI